VLLKVLFFFSQEEAGALAGSATILAPKAPQAAKDTGADAFPSDDLLFQDLDRVRCSTPERNKQNLSRLAAIRIRARGQNVMNPKCYENVYWEGKL